MCVLLQIPAGDNLGGKVYDRNGPTTGINHISTTSELLIVGFITYRHAEVCTPPVSFSDGIKHLNSQKPQKL